MQSLSAALFQSDQKLDPHASQVSLSVKLYGSNGCDMFGRIYHKGRTKQLPKSKWLIMHKLASCC